MCPCCWHSTTKRQPLCSINPAFLDPNLPPCLSHTQVLGRLPAVDFRRQQLLQADVMRRLIGGSPECTGTASTNRLARQHASDCRKQQLLQAGGVNCWTREKGSRLGVITGSRTCSGIWHMIFGQTTAVAFLWEYALADEGFVGFFLSFCSSLVLKPEHDEAEGGERAGWGTLPACGRAPGCQHITMCK